MIDQVGNCPECGAPIYSEDLSGNSDKWLISRDGKHPPVRVSRKCLPVVRFTCPCHEWLQEKPVESPASAGKVCPASNRCFDGFGRRCLLGGPW